MNTIGFLREIFSGPSRVENDQIVEADSEAPKNYSCLVSDFSDEMLAMETMRLGVDPSNLSRDEMMDIIYQAMELNKPPACEDEENENA